MRATPRRASAAEVAERGADLGRPRRRANPRADSGRRARTTAPTPSRTARRGGARGAPRRPTIITPMRRATSAAFCAWPMVCATWKRCAASVGVEVDPVVDLGAGHDERVAGVHRVDREEHDALGVAPHEHAGDLAVDDAREERRHAAGRLGDAVTCAAQRRPCVSAVRRASESAWAPARRRARRRSTPARTAPRRRARSRRRRRAPTAAPRTARAPPTPRPTADRAEQRAAERAGEQAAGRDRQHHERGDEQHADDAHRHRRPSPR